VASYFLDSSAIFKRYVSESGSSWVISITDPAAMNDIYLAQITGVEVVSGFVRQVPPLLAANLARILADFRFDFQHQYQRIEINETVISKAMKLAETYRLRGYDSVPLAAGVELNDSVRRVGLPIITFVSADHQLNTAAVAEGLVVDDPTSHP
jgi:uncharacterized protein